MMEKYKKARRKKPEIKDKKNMITLSEERNNKKLINHTKKTDIIIVKMVSGSEIEAEAEAEVEAEAEAST